MWLLKARREQNSNIVGVGVNICSVEGCARKHEAKGYCSLHYQRVYKHGDPTVRKSTNRGRPEQPLEDLFWSKVNIGGDDDCWLWTGATLRGYGTFTKGRRVGLSGSAHRISWILHNGPIPDGMEIHHACGSRSCVNPAHLECVSPEEHRCRHERRSPKVEISILQESVAILQEISGNKDLIIESLEKENSHLLGQLLMASAPAGHG
jgi:hypothetical protein